MPIGKHISLKATSGGEPIFKPYTPVSDEDVHKGFIDFVIKVGHYEVLAPRNCIAHLLIAQQVANLD